MNARRLLLVLTCAVMLFGCISSAQAQAQTVSYTLQTGSTAVPGAIKLTGQQVTTFNFTVSPTSCTSGDPENSSDSLWSIALTSPATLNDGQFQISGTAPSAYYTGSGSYTVTGQVNANQTVITGTITLTNANDQFLQGCSASEQFIAIPTVTDERGPGNANATYQSQFVNFNYRGGVISNLLYQANFQCSNYVNSAEFSMSDYAVPAIHTNSAGKFSMTDYIFDEYSHIVLVKISGQVSAKTAHGSISVSEPAGLSGVAGGTCQGTQNWTATRPTPPAPPGPEAFFTWDAVRVPVQSGYHYYFYVSALTCSNGANELRIVVARHISTIRCRLGGGWASGPLAPGTIYSTTATPIKVVRNRIVKRGTAVTEPVRMPGADDIWVPIGKLPTAPPA